MSFLDETWDAIKSGVSDTTGAAVASGKAKVSSGVSKWFGRVVRKISDIPEVQEKAKSAAGEKLGVSLIDNWKYLAAAVVGLIILAIATRKLW